MALPATTLRRLLAQVRPDNAQGEYYLTDLVALAIAEGTPVEGIQASADEIFGVNDREQLAQGRTHLPAAGGAAAHGGRGDLGGSRPPRRSRRRDRQA